MNLTYTKKSYSSDPFLSIITRVYKRPQGLAENLLSIDSLTDKDIEQIFITDTIGIGLLRANQSFSDKETRALVTGKYVFLLDDDDKIINPEMTTELKAVADQHNPDVIFFRMIIKINQIPGNLYPTDELCWGKKPIIARIGGSCFVVKREIYEKFIHKFGVARCGDFAFIDAVWESGASVYWHDVIMCETGKVSRGKPE
jgi:glycosyltransferase involved in cell wall biosynthesis